MQHVRESRATQRDVREAGDILQIPEDNVQARLHAAQRITSGGDGGGGGEGEGGGGGGDGDGGGGGGQHQLFRQMCGPREHVISPPRPVTLQSLLHRHWPLVKLQSADLSYWNSVT